MLTEYLSWAGWRLLSPLFPQQRDMEVVASVGPGNEGESPKTDAVDDPKTDIHDDPSNLKGVPESG